MKMFHTIRRMEEEFKSLKPSLRVDLRFIASKIVFELTMFNEKATVRLYLIPTSFHSKSKLVKAHLIQQYSRKYVEFA